MEIGGGTSFFEENIVKKHYPGNLTFQGVTDNKLLVSESTETPFNTRDPQQEFVHNLNIDCDGILGLNPYMKATMGL